MRKNIAFIISATLFLAPLAVSCSDVDYPGKRFQQNQSVEKINEAVAETIREGNLTKMMPPAIVMVFGTLIPITATVGFFVFLVIFVRLNHRKSMSMIEKGVYEPPKRRWDMVSLFVGLILSFVGVGVSITTASYFGPQPWTILSGIIPLFLGIAFIIFYRVYGKKVIDR